jgi:hypothetical protein
MNMMRSPSQLWRLDYLTVGVETVARNTRRVPLSWSHALVRDGRVTSAHHHPIAWWRPGGAAGQVQTAVATAETARALAPEDLLEGMAPPRAFTLLEEVFREAALGGLLLVTHDPSGRLKNLLSAIENTLDVAPAPLEAVNTAVLERAGQLGLRQTPGEPDPAYYRRLERVVGLLPDLPSCYQEGGWPTGDVRPGDRLFGVLATHRLYECHRARARGQDVKVNEKPMNS